MERRWLWRGLTLGLFLMGAAMAVWGWTQERRPEPGMFVRTVPASATLPPAPNSPIASAFGAQANATEADALPGGSVFALPGRWLDSAGKARTWPDFAGRAAVITFIYTRCDDVCPTTVSVVNQALDETNAAAARGIAVSFDPWRDDPAALAAFARRLGLNGHRWTLLTPQDETALDALTTLLGVTVLPMGEEFLHTDVAFALDADGHVQRRLAHPSRDPAALARQVAGALSAR